MNKVAIVDDFEDSCSLMSEILSPYFQCKYTSNSEQAMQLIESFSPDIILMDYKMPILNGLDIIKTLKQKSSTKNIPVIFISGEASSDERVETLEFGGDDFISKPFHPKELVLRVQKRLQHSQSKSALTNNELKVANLIMQLNSRLVYVNNNEITLTPKQFEILKLLVENKNNLVSRTTFMEEIWGHSEVTPRNVDSQINYLKKKIEGFEGVITAVPSFGYRLDFKN